MIGRKKEIKRIKRALASKRSEFLAITGRRRVGKTFLVDTVLREHFCFAMTGIQKGDSNAQLINFGVKLSEYDGTFDPVISKNWQEAFLQLKKYLKTLEKSKKQVIFIDELPWVNTPRSGFVQFLAHLWNDYLSKESHFILVICGSATSWISQKVINDPGGLHNRVTEIIHLRPFSLSETKAFLKDKGFRMSDQEVAKFYMAIGGIPYYLEKIHKGESFPVAIERICFSPEGPLRNEYDNLYRALFNNSDIHQAIVNVLAAHHYGLTNAQILSKMGAKSSGSYQRAMKELIVSDFVMENQAFGKKKRGTYYRLIDEYSIFYHRFIQPNKKYTPGIWQKLATGQPYKIWTGYAFESLCHKHIAEIKQALGIPAVFTEISSLNIPNSPAGKGFQVDLLISRGDNYINFCEIKFHSGKFTITKDYYERIIQKRLRFIESTRTREQVSITFITNHGVVKNEYGNELVEAEVTLSDLM